MPTLLPAPMSCCSTTRPSSSCAARRCGPLSPGVWIALGVGLLVATGLDPFALHTAVTGAFAWLVGGLVAGLRLLVGLWAYADAERRRLNGWLVGGGVALVAWPLGAIAWLLLRGRYPETDA